MKGKVAWSLFAAAIFIVISVRVIGIDMTEGRQLIEFWWAYLASLALIAAAATLMETS